MKRQLAKPGSERVRSGFLWWPRVIRNEWRWLERARWREKCAGNFFFDGVRHWWGVEWLEGDE